MEIEKLLDEYFEKFNESFPMMQAPNTEKAIKHITKCLDENQRAPDLFPDIYGALVGVNA